MSVYCKIKVVLKRSILDNELLGINSSGVFSMPVLEGDK